MNIGVVLAQLAPTPSVPDNVDAIRTAIAAARPGDVVLTPEGSLSGYSEDPSFLDSVAPDEVEAALGAVGEAAVAAGVDVWVGACTPENGRWFNAACGLTADGRRLTYRKVNLATSERRRFAAGDALPTFSVPRAPRSVTTGVQICREVRFPEQWRALADAGAELFLHLNNAIGESPPSAWRSMLVARAVENQRFVASVNAVGLQRSPTIAVAPSGDVLAEASGTEPELLRVELDLDEIDDTFLRQRRRDLIPTP
jgi:predicted amidohydrolase